MFNKQDDFDETLLQSLKFTPITPAILLYAETSPIDIYMDTGRENYSIII